MMKLIQLGDQSVLEMWIKNCGKKTIVTAPDNSLLEAIILCLTHCNPLHSLFLIQKCNVFLYDKMCFFPLQNDLFNKKKV